MLTISAATLTNSLGQGLAATKQALLEQKHGLKPCDFADCQLDTYIGEVAKLDQVRISDAAYNTRNHRLALLALEQDDFITNIKQAKERYGSERVAVIIGTTTSSIREAEQAYKQRDLQGRLPKNFKHAATLDLYAVTDFVRQTLGLQGPAYSIGSACASSSKAMISAKRMLQADICDAVVIGGVDSLCLTTLYGFSSLGVTSSQLMRPCDKDRDGLNLGEGAAFALIERSEQADNSFAEILGFGESTDAYHISAPHIEGQGAKIAMQGALAMAGIDPKQIDYINMHGTASFANDLAESQAIFEIFQNKTPASSTKGWTGHTLGTAGLAETIICALAMQNELIPNSLNTENLDPAIKIQVPLKLQHKQINYCLNNAFGFGGSNSCVLLGASR